MLRVGLTGGIGSGKSTVAQRFRELGAIVLDADQLAREVVGAGSTGLAAIRRRFGDAVMAPDGSLDRPAMGRVVFADTQARRDLEAITHPLIAARTQALLESAAPEAIVVHEVPLLVELDLAASYHLTVVVGTDEDLRTARLTGDRGFTPADARARIAAQVGDRERRAAADVWLDNNGTVHTLLAQADALWQDRILGFNENLLTGSSSHQSPFPTLVAYDDSWPPVAARLIRRVELALGERALAVVHIGSTSVPGLTGNDVIDLQIAVPRLSAADDPGFVRAMADRGFPRTQGVYGDTPGSWAPDASLWGTRVHGCADPGRVVHLHVRELDSPGWQLSILFRDWLIANPTERDAYADLKRGLVQTTPTTPTTREYTLAKEPWVVQAVERARGWARHTGWRIR